MTWRMIQADCSEAMGQMDEASLDAIVTDPPYELGFMGKRWDRTGAASSVDLWRAALRVLKPGGHLLSFGASRTYHRMASAIEDAGFEIRDSLHWIYGTGFPKSMDVAAAIDANLGAERPAPGPEPVSPMTAEGAAWQNFGTGLKPAHEPIVLARKPPIGTVARNILAHGTGVLNVGACRIPFTSGRERTEPVERSAFYSPHTCARGLGTFERTPENVRDAAARYAARRYTGRWPPNVLFDEAAAEILDKQAGETTSSDRPRFNRARDRVFFGQADSVDRVTGGYDDAGGVSRYFPVFYYASKARRAERDAGLHDLEPRSGGAATDRQDGTAGLDSPRAGAGRLGDIRNFHPTVKPVALMEWLVQLVTPPRGTVLDPFAGSGTTGCAAVRLGFNFIGIEREPEYVALAERRIALAENAPRTKGLGALERDDGALPGQLALFPGR